MNFNEPGNKFPNYSSGGEKQPTRLSAFFPLLFALMLAIGVLLGYNIQSGGPGQVGPNNKLNYIINLIDKEYVDSVKSEDLMDKAISGMLTELDPHSLYLSPKDVQRSDEELSGKFGGVGIQFIVQNDTLMVTHLVKDGPADKKGVQAFDRILMVDKKKFHSKKITTEEVFDALRGDIGSRVVLSLYRPKEKKKLEAIINRGIIPVSSVECAVLLDNTGLIKISQFGEDTYPDFLKAARELKKQGMKKMIVDLRDNGGGYLQAAQNISDQFLKENMKIVYTKGKNQGRYDYMATSTGEFEDMPVVILVNHNSASASEIVAGAIQDNDRGMIVGRRTFGKGLVQQQFSNFSDGSALRLTVARYYTPSGRSIQRPYGHGIDYFHDGIDRYTNNEFFKPDSSKLVDSLKYKTIVKKRTVYGGGGIMPDVFVPLDTTFSTAFYGDVLSKNCVNSFAFTYTERNLSKLRDYGTYYNFGKQFVFDENLWNDFMAYSISKGVKQPSQQDLDRSKKWIESLVTAEISRLAFSNEGYYFVRMSQDSEVRKALNSF